MSSRWRQPPAIFLNKDLETMTAWKRGKSKFIEKVFKTFIKIFHSFHPFAWLLLLTLKSREMFCRDNLFSARPNLRTCPAVASGNPPAFLESQRLQQQKINLEWKSRSTVSDSDYEIWTPCASSNFSLLTPCLGPPTYLSSLRKRQTCKIIQNIWEKVESVIHRITVGGQL